MSRSTSQTPSGSTIRATLTMHAGQPRQPLPRTQPMPSPQTGPQPTATAPPTPPAGTRRTCLILHRRLVRLGLGDQRRRIRQPRLVQAAVLGERADGGLRRLQVRVVTLVQ